MAYFMYTTFFWKPLASLPHEKSDDLPVSALYNFFNNIIIQRTYM